MTGIKGQEWRKPKKESVAVRVRMGLDIFSWVEKFAVENKTTISGSIRKILESQIK